MTRLFLILIYIYKKDDSGVRRLREYRCFISPKAMAVAWVGQGLFYTENLLAIQQEIQARVAGHKAEVAIA